MALFGIDTSQPASQPLLNAASGLNGGVPQFWGRYFNGTSDQSYQYRKEENAFLHQQKIPVLCFARQMKYLTDPKNAQTHAKANMQGVLDAFGAQYLLHQNISPLMFLDVESENTAHPPLNQKYYENWSAAIASGLTVPGGKIKFQPAVYLNLKTSPSSWMNLNAACDQGAVCVGVSVAFYVYTDPKDKKSPPPSFEKLKWDDAILTPEPNPLPIGHPNAHIPVIAWQYYGNYPKQNPNHHVDPNLVNPAHEPLVLSGVVPAPAPGM